SRSPVMAPDLEGPEFIPSEEITSVARDVLSLHGGAGGVVRLFDLARAIRDGEISVVYLFNTKAWDELTEREEHDTAGKCMKAPRLWHDLTGYDVAIWIRQYLWQSWDVATRR